MANLLSWHQFYWFLIEMFTGFMAAHCSSCDLFKVASLQCECSEQIGMDNIGGWSLYCYDGNFPENAFTIDYMTNKGIKIECNPLAPYRPALLEGLKVSEITEFHFRFCPLPNISFAEVLSGMTVKHINFERHDKVIISVSTFKDLPNLQHLVLKNNELTTLAANTFNDLTALKSIVLIYNSITELPENVFHQTVNLTTLDLSFNKLLSLPSNIFSKLTQLQSLYIRNNQIQQIPDSLFRNLTSLKTLELSGNLLTELSPSVFAGLDNVQDIGMKQNKFKTLPAGLFQTVPNLQRLDLSDNPSFEYLPDLLLEGSKNLTSIFLNNCALHSLPVEFFSPARNLVTIEMWNNRLTSLPSQLFTRNTKLESLDLSFNDLLSVPADAFENLYKLDKLVIIKNNLTKLLPGVFDHLIQLRMLNLTSNFLEALPKNIFSRLQRLEALNLRNNRIRRLDGINPLGLSPALEHVDLSKNRIESIDGINWSIHHKLQVVNLTSNLLDYLAVPVFSAKNTSCFFQHNKIVHVDVSGVQLSDEAAREDPAENPGRHKFYLEGNLLDCNCSLWKFVEYARTAGNDWNQVHSAIFPDADQLMCNNPPKLSGQAILPIPWQNYLCQVKNDCSHPCKCFRRANDDAIIMDCSGLGLDTLPVKVPFNTTILIFDNNKLTSATDLFSLHWENLTELYLNNNKLTSVNEWPRLPHLKLLKLSGNKLKWMPEELMEFTSTQQFSVWLGTNPWECSCALLKFKSWIILNSDIVRDVDNISCSNIYAQNSTTDHALIVEMSEDAMCPRDNHTMQFILLSTVCAVLTVMFVAISVLYYRNKQKVTAYVYIHLYNIFVCLFTEEDLDEDKVFDAFVSYSGQDRDVALGLLRKLESCTPPFKLCVHERDWLPGNPISWNIANSVQNSRRTILILSKAFLESMWFQVEFHTAYYQMLEDRVNRLIVVVRDELPPKESLDSDLQHLLSTKTYLVWGEHWFWEQLQYAMPHHQRDKPIPNQLPLQHKPNTKMLKAVEDQLANHSLNMFQATKVPPNRQRNLGKHLSVSSRAESMCSQDSIATEISIVQY